jgi:uncharacterized protein YukE
MASKEERAEAIEQFATRLADFAKETEAALVALKGQISSMRDSGQIDVEDYAVYEPEFEQAAGTMQAALNEFSDSQAGRLQNLAGQIREAAY